MTESSGYAARAGARFALPPYCNLPQARWGFTREKTGEPSQSSVAANARSNMFIFCSRPVDLKNVIERDFSTGFSKPAKNPLINS